ncbi:hypothetical protein [Crossiella sp. SN42]|nr:hypothetical protein [Crossiella sp. SN42]
MSLSVWLSLISPAVAVLVAAQPDPFAETLAAELWEGAHVEPRD